MVNGAIGITFKCVMTSREGKQFRIRGTSRSEQRNNRDTEKGIVLHGMRNVEPLGRVETRHRIGKGCLRKINVHVLTQRIALLLRHTVLR